MAMHWSLPSMPLVLESPIASNPVSAPTQHMTIVGQWEHFQMIQRGFEQSKARLSYYDGRIEIIMPGRLHELFKSVIGMLIEAYLVDRRVNFCPTGSMTQAIEEVASAEADESYEIGESLLVIEVRVTSGSLLKLLTYQALDVNEVWFWEDGVLAVYHLMNGEYEKFEQSQIPELRGIDIVVFNQCVLMGETNRIGAIDALRSAHPM
jgi:Uma2 family endonuclease